MNLIDYVFSYQIRASEHRSRHITQNFSTASDRFPSFSQLFRLVDLQDDLNVSFIDVDIRSALLDHIADGHVGSHFSRHALSRCIFHQYYHFLGSVELTGCRFFALDTGTEMVSEGENDFTALLRVIQIFQHGQPLVRANVASDVVLLSLVSVCVHKPNCYKWYLVQRLLNVEGGGSSLHLSLLNS